MDDEENTKSLEENIKVGSSKDPFVGDDMKLRVGRSLGLDKFSDVKKYQHNIERLIDWGKEKGAKDAEDLIWNIRQLANRVGSAPLGQNTTQHLSTYAYLEMERMKIDKQLEEMSK